MAMSEKHVNAEFRPPVAELAQTDDVEFELSPLPADTVMRMNDARCGCCQCVVACITCVVKPTGE